MNKRVTIMQPYFMPYIGYFQLISSVDEFIIYDNIKYTKKGWINRNRFLMNNNAEVFSLPLAKASDSLSIAKRYLSSDFNEEKIENKLRGAYHGAPFFNETMALLSDILSFPDKNLFRFLHNSVCKICEYLDIKTNILVSSTIEIDHSLTSEKKVIELCRAVGASVYINSTGGRKLYDAQTFSDQNLELRFLESNALEYAQFESPFVPMLSIID